MLDHRSRGMQKTSNELMWGFVKAYLLLGNMDKGKS